MMSLHPLLPADYRRLRHRLYTIKCCLTMTLVIPDTHSLIPLTHFLRRPNRQNAPCCVVHVRASPIPQRTIQYAHDQSTVLYDRDCDE